VAVLRSAELEKGSALTEEEVIAIRDGASCITMPERVARRVIESRGYDDIDPGNAWEEWQNIRKIFSEE
jgi:hypothetical protein